MKDSWMEKEQWPTVGEPTRNGKSSNDYVEKPSWLSDLPEACIATILSYLPPREVAKAACVCQSFRLASQCDSIWASQLPPGHMEMLELIMDPKPVFKSKKDILIYLTMPKFFAKGTKAYWIDTATGGVMLSISARGLCSVHNNSHRQCNWMRSENSLFAEVAQLEDVHWFQAWVDFEVAFPPRCYTLSWRMKVERPSNFGDEVIFSTFSTSSQNVLGGTCFNGRSYVYPCKNGVFTQEVIHVVDNHWQEYDVAEFFVDTEGPTCTLSVGIRINCMGSMRRTWIAMDGIVIKPSNTIKDLKGKSPLV